MANTGGNWLEGECGGCHLCACREMVLLGRKWNIIYFANWGKGILVRLL